MKSGAFGSTVTAEDGIASIDVQGCTTLWIQFLVASANLSAFKVNAKVVGSPDVTSFQVAGASADYTSPNGHPVVRASGDLTTAAAGSTMHWMKLNVQGLSRIELRADSGTESGISGWYMAV